MVILTCLLLISPARADEIPLASETTIPRGESITLTFEPISTGDTTVLLETYARMDSPGLGGSTLFMDLTLNDEPLRPAKSRTIMRLMNRKPVSPITPTLIHAWYGGRGGWRVVYAADFETAKTQDFYEGDPYRLLIDVTDLVDTAEENQLVITSTATDAFAKRVGTDLDLVFDHVTLLTQPGVSPTLNAEANLQPIINRGEPAAGPAEFSADQPSDSEVLLTIGDERLSFATKLASAGDHCTRARRVDVSDRKITIADSITNTSDDAEIGIQVTHALDLSERPDPVVRLAGNPDPGVDSWYSPANPSVHVRLEDLGLGMICEDDVFRNQATLFFDADAIATGLRTDRLYLGPGESETLEWSIYPVAGPDYFDFINLVRDDWGSNYTVEGAWVFFLPDMIIDRPVDEIRADIDRLGIRYACMWGGWVDAKSDPKRIGFGAEVLSDYWADYRRRIALAIAKLREASPEMKVLIYYDTQRGTYADASTRFADSRLTNHEGEHGSTEWSGVYSLTWSMFASLTNSFGKATLDAVDAYFDELGADGLYWDEMECTSYGVPLVTYDQPDGRTCVMDPDSLEITQQIGVTTLLGEKHRLAVIDKCRALGGTLMGNGPTTTRGLLAARVQRMVEIQHNDTWCYEGNLDTPLGYASSRMDFGNITRALDLATLLVGTRFDYDYEITPHLFPFTPIQLHAGYLLGEERIIVTHSGEYCWHGESVQAVARFFDVDGKLRDTSAAQTISSAAPFAVTLSPGEACVIARAE